MTSESRMHNLMGTDANDYVRIQEETDERREEFMFKFLRRKWPFRLVALLGTLQLLIGLIIVAVDLPIILMFAPRWEVFVAAWTFVFMLLAAISTLHTIRQTSWSKLKWAAGLNILGALVAGLMIAFNILFLVNPYICLSPTGCKYLGYTYTKSGSFMAGEVVLGIAFLVTVFLFLILYIKFGIGGKVCFEDIQDGVLVSDNVPIMMTPTGPRPGQQNPAGGQGVRMAQRGATMPGGAKPRSAMMNTGVRPPMPPLPPGAQMVNTQQGPMIMVPNPQGGQPSFFRPPAPYGQTPYGAPMMPNVAAGQN